MLRRLCFILACVAASLTAQEDPAPTIPQLTKDGDAAYLKGDYDAASQTFTRAWELAQATPKDDPLRYDILKRLTSVRAAAGEFADADNWLQQAITWRENTLGQKDHKIADDLLISVGLCRGMKDFDRALVILRRVQSLHVEAYTLDSPMVADDFSRMGNIYAEQKKIDSAINAIAAALAIRTKLGGPLDPVLIADLDRLGEYNTLMRAYDQAEEAFRHVLVIRETLYGKTHPDLISTVDGLAYALFGQQKYDEADPVYQRLIGLWESSVGKDHAMVAVALDKLAVFYSAQKKYAETRDALERSAAIRARFLAMGISQQAVQAFTEEQNEQAKAFYRRGLAVLDPPNPINDDLRAQFEGMLKAMEAPPPKSAAPVKRLPTPPKKTNKL
jgi:tetratricopeptide (TPR) repeat protein